MRELLQQNFRISFGFGKILQSVPQELGDGCDANAGQDEQDERDRSG
ncbi:hypothetical protein [Bradyrhizobium sp. CCGUVB14]|nr:hypothetical protein [Bradyrhizobium sp. CCGUVB14]MCP3442249.1 hypothetical protein [Bradyrhizobium sp. CCGUVB14]